MNHSEIIQGYTQLLPGLESSMKQIENELRSVLLADELKVYSISSRIKSIESLKKKIARPDRTYNSLDQVTDIAGFRVVTYFEDSIEELGRLIENNFSVDYEHSTNKLRTLDHERFGYRSMHYICSHPTLKTIRFEIQIRTVLQHAWAEIEHDLGYKSIEGVPGIIRRRFSQIASILEIADREFVAIRHDVRLYEEKIKRFRIDGDATLPLDPVMLKSILEHDKVADLDRKLAKILGLKIEESAFYPDYLLRALAASKLTTAKSVIDAIEKFEPDFAKFVKPYFEFAKGAWNFESRSVETIRRGYSLLFIAHLTMLSKEPLVIDKVNEAVQFYEALDYQDRPHEAVRVGRQLVESLQISGYFRDES